MGDEYKKCCPKGGIEREVVFTSAVELVGEKGGDKKGSGGNGT